MREYLDDDLDRRSIGGNRLIKYAGPTPLQIICRNEEACYDCGENERVDDFELREVL